MMKVIPFSVLYFVAVIVIAHFFAPPGYNWTQNTISEFASQGHANKWIMQLGFIGFGLFLTAGLVWKSYRFGKINYPDLLIALYGLSILVTGIFCAAPYDDAISFSIKEAQIHSMFATVAGFALVAGILWNLVVSPEKRTFHFVFIILITGLSLLFGLAESGTIHVGKGIIQRVLYLVTFIWLVYL
jgi:hypothetical membrane protein